MHPVDLYPRGYLISPYTANIAKFRNTIVTYTKVENFLLPEPYPTACLNYGHVVFESQMDCIEACVTNHTRNRTAGLMPTTTVKEKMDNRRMEPVGSYDPQMRLKCIDSCAIDCAEELYFATLLIREDRGNRTLSIAVNEAEYRTAYSPINTVSSLVIYLAGVASLWLGFSIYVSAKDAMQLLVRVGGRCCKRK